MSREAWIRDLFCSIDAKDCDRWLEFLARDACFRFGNSPIVEGRDAIRETITAFFDSISALRHDIIKIWDQPDTVICRGEVTYTRLDHSTLCIPFANVLRLSDNLIREYLVYVDASELYTLPSR